MATSHDQERRLRKELKRKIEIVESSPARPSEALIQYKLRLYGDKCFDCSSIIQQARYEFVSLMSSKEDLLDRRGGPLHFLVKIQQLHDMHEHKKKEILANVENFVLAHEWYEILVAADEVEELKRLEFLSQLSEEVCLEPTEPGQSGYPNPVEVHRNYERRSVTGMVQYQMIAFDTLLQEERDAVDRARMQVRHLEVHEERTMGDLRLAVEQLQDEVHGQMDHLRESVEKLKERVDAMESALARRTVRILESVNEKHAVMLHKVEEYFRSLEGKDSRLMDDRRSKERRERDDSRRKEYEDQLKYYQEEREKIDDFIERNTVRERYFGARMMRKREGCMMCVYCTEVGNHYSDACPRVRTVRERKHLLHSQNRCFICLEQHEGECGDVGNCFYCKNSRQQSTKEPDHHASICTKPEEFAIALKRRKAVRANIQHYLQLLEDLDAKEGPSSASICDNAPTPALQITCQQITNWDRNTRAVRPITRGLVAAPGSAGTNSLGVGVSPVATSTTPSTVYDCLDIACLCGYFGGTGGSTCTLPNGQSLTKAVRKEFRVLTDDERQNYITAMRTIKGNGDYDDIGRIHAQFVTSPGAHSGPAFLPWHREYIKRLEIALRRVDPTLALPYWDSTLDSSLPDPSQSCFWGNELMGTQGSDGSVTTGAFRNWRTLDGSRVFSRSVGTTGNLLRDSDIQILLASSDFTQLLAFTAPQPGCPNPAPWTVLEYVHGGPHVFTGGDMLITTSATNDPVFFNHHSMIDHIWELWRLARQSRSQRETQYPMDNSLCSSNSHYANNTMAPFFPKVNLDGLSNAYTDNLYQYDPRPTCTRANPNGCRSKYLFCDLSHGSPRCASKINIGGTCSGYTNNEDRCYLGQCINNVCAMTPTPTPTTQPPIETTTPIVPAPETCYNEQQCCAPWASRGECTRNPTYMRLWCKASCGVCTPTTYNLNTECSDRSVRCTEWAGRGECRSNAGWMTENCRQSCNACGTTRLQACGGGACLNQHYCCIAWASRGYCTARNQRSFMMQYCQPICGLCSGSPAGSTTYNTQACSDFNPSRCAAWTAQNQCAVNPNYMWENCRQSCGVCNIGILSNRLSSCGLTRRRLASQRRVNPQTSRQSIRTSSRNVQAQRTSKAASLPAISQFRRPTRPGPPSSALPVGPSPPRLRKPPQCRRRPRPARREPTPSTQQSRARPLQNNSRPRSRGPARPSGEAVPQRNLARPLASVPQRRQALQSRNSTFS